MRKYIRFTGATLLLLLMMLCFTGCGHQETAAADSEKTITIVVTHKDGTVNTVETTTKSEFLAGPLEELELINPASASDGYYTTVDGETADTNKEEWWCLTIDGDSSITGFDDTPVEDGHSYEITFTTGW